MNNTFSIRESIALAWKLLTSRFWFFVGATALLLLIQIVVRVAAIIPILGIFVILAVGIYTSMGIVKFSLRAHDAPDMTKIMSLWAPHPFWRFLLALALAGLIAIGPVLLTVVLWGLLILSGSVLGLGAAGILHIIDAVLIPVLFAVSVVWAMFVGVRLMFVKFIVMDRDMAIVASLKESARITKGNWWKLFGLGIVLALINVLGAVCLLVGLLVSVPLTWLAIAHVYRTLEHEAHEIMPESPTMAA